MAGSPFGGNVKPQAGNPFQAASNVDYAAHMGVLDNHMPQIHAPRQ